MELCQTVRCLVLVLSAASSVLCFHLVTVNDHFLVGHVFLKRDVDWVYCIKLCEESPLCISYNYHKSDPDRACQLNNRGVKNLCEQEDPDLVYQKGVVFQQLKKPRECTRRRKGNSGNMTLFLPGCDSLNNPNIQVKTVGCFKDTTKRALPKRLLGTTRNVDWQNFEQFLKGFICKCATEAKNNSFKIFGIQYYGECWSGAGGEKSYNKHGTSNKCVDGGYNRMDVQCSDNRNTIFSGENRANYVYRIV